MSEVLPMVQRASADLQAKRQTWVNAREDRDRKVAKAKSMRASLIVQLRVWGTAETGSEPIKTSAERVEWCNADPEVQQAELEADLAQTVQMAAHEAYQDAQASFGLLQSYLGFERDQFKAERHGG